MEQLEQKQKAAEDKQKEAEQKQRDAESNQKVAEDRKDALVHTLKEVCQSLLDFDMQVEAEPEQRIEKLKEYAQQAQSQIEKIRADHEAQIAELKLHLRPETPPHVRAQQLDDIKASAHKISNLVRSVAKLLEESVVVWESLQ